MRIVIVDDELLTRVGLKSMLDWEAYGYSLVAEVPDGQRALQAIHEYRPDVVLTDIKMPVMDGIQLIQQINQLPFTRPQIIVLSGYNDFAFVKEAMRLGAVDYLLKLEMEKEDLLGALKRIEATLREGAEAEDSKSREQRELERQAITQALLHGKITDAGDLFLNQRHFQIRAFFRMQSKTQGHPEVIQNAIENIAQEIVADVPHARAAYGGEGRFYLLLHGKNSPSEQQKKAFSDLCLQINEKVEKYLNVTLGWSPPHYAKGLQELKDAYGKCLSKLVVAEAGYSQSPLMHLHEKPLPRAIRKSLEYISLHYMENISLQDMTKISGLSVSYFGSSFRQHTGYGFVDYLNRIRLEHAKKMLQNTKLKIYQIAQHVGYQNSFYFNRLFKKVEGMTPVEYRNFGLSAKAAYDPKDVD